METQLPSTSPPPCCSLRSRLICVSAGLAVLVLVAIVSFLLGKYSSQPKIPSIAQISPMPTNAVPIPAVDPTTSWKTVSNEQVGISFKYPDNLLPYTNTPQVPDSTYFGFDAFSSQEKRDHRTLTEADLELELIVYKPIKGNQESYLSAIRATDNTTISQSFPGITGSYTKVKTITSGSTQTAIIYAEPAREFSEYDAIVVNNKNVAVIRLMTGSHSKRQELLPLLDQILSTFRFD